MCLAGRNQSTEGIRANNLMGFAKPPFGKNLFDTGGEGRVNNLVYGHLVPWRSCDASGRLGCQCDVNMHSSMIADWAPIEVRRSPLLRANLVSPAAG